MASNRLKLNVDKTQFIWLGSPRQLETVSQVQLVVGVEAVTAHRFLFLVLVLSCFLLIVFMNYLLFSSFSFLFPFLSLFFSLCTLTTFSLTPLVYRLLVLFLFFLILPLFSYFFYILVSM